MASENVTKIVEELKALTVLELSELVSAEIGRASCRERV